MNDRLDIIVHAHQAHHQLGFLSGRAAPETPPDVEIDVIILCDF